MAATMRDVARLAGVSLKTVSNVVNDFPHVSAQTRELVRATSQPSTACRPVSARSV